MTPPSPSTLRRLSVRFRRAEGGATAVEFGMVALPFVMLFMGILEVALAYTASTMLDNALYQVSRQIRTGELNMLNSSKNQFRDAVCAKMYFLEDDCKVKLAVDVRSATGFNNISLTTAVTNGNFLNPSSTQFNTGTTGSVMVVQAFYRWKLIAPSLNQGMVRTGSGEAVISAVTAFRNEPW